jgi:hypothetical protein
MAPVRKEEQAAKPPTEWVSLAEASRLLGIQRLKVLRLALCGELVSDVRGQWTFISRKSIDRYLAREAAVVAE